ncbi:hypothetical protein [Tenacibaculum jejuense]|uniref:Secretion system C-terminal sorting domain-containing protein n=1 Tax=Tenacibaculum jejuense TaxID=584609 RepID=A0A238UA05_9FLAO|nr:hypothetical protein [Tenacibaculum jejuense]SNR15294.1 Protein of unknown function precursor containing leucine-rich repeat. Probable adhesin [Tenacibaculum jejuense]
MKKKILLVLTIFSFLAYSQNSCTLDETKLTGTFTTTSVGGTKIKASDAASNHRFGERVVIDGNIAVTVSRSNGEAAGKVYVYTNDGSGNWSQQTILTASDSFAGDNFGSSIALQGNYLVVGASAQTNSSAVDTGAAYLFEYDGSSTWTEVAIFEPSDGSSDDRFGVSASIEGNMVLIGARNGSVGGCAYLYENDGTGTFTYTETKLEPQVQSNYSGARFGHDVLIKNGRAYVSGPYDYSSVGNASAGSVQVWDQANDGTWLRTHRLRGTLTNETFGWSIDVEGDYLAIGAMKFETSSTSTANEGRVYVYKADINGDYLDSNRVMIQNTDKDSFADQRLGTDVAIENGFLYVGTWGDGKTNGDAVYIFKDDGTNNWSQLTKLTSGNGWDEFSNRAVAVSYPYLLVGQNEDDSPSNSGAIHFVPLASTVTPTASITDSTGASIGQNNATITLNFSDEATKSEIQFSVDGGVTYPYTFNDDLGTADITNLGVGTYDLKARFNNGSCELDLGTVTINQLTYTAIPDANFEARLEALGYDDISGDGQVPTSLIETVTELQLAGQNITDLTGIEDFTALEELKANGNNITTVDLSNNTALKLFQMTSSSSLGSIDVSNNPVLEDLQIRSLSSAIDISNLTALDRFACVDCTFTILDTSGNPNLRHLDLEDTPVTALDLSTNTNLEILELENTSLVALDLSKNTSFKYLYAQDITTLTTLNIQNGNNTNINAFDIIGTPVFCVLVDDITYSTTNWTDIDSATLFSETNCNYTAIPDATFEAVLESQGYDNISGDGQVPTFLIESLTVLNISSKGVTDLTGIEDFTALEELKANQNNLTSIDLTNNTALKVLWIRQGNNNFSSIDVSENLALEDFRIQYSGTSLDISNNTALVQFMCTDCSLTTLNTSNNTNLTSLDLEGSDITSLDLSANVNLTGLEIDKTSLVELDLSKNTALKYLYAEDITTLTGLNIQNGTNTNISAFETVGTPVPCVLVDDVAYSTSNWTDIEATTSFSATYCDYTTIPDANFEAALNSLGYDDISGDGQVPTELIEVVTTLDVSNQNIADLTGIEDFVALTDLNLDTNVLTSLDLSSNSNLQNLNFDNNTIATLNLGTISKLESIEGRYNQLSTIDLSQNPNLTFINLRNNLFTTINVANNPLLETINLRACANLTSIDISNNTNVKNLFFQDTPLNGLDVSNNSLLEVIVIERVNFNSIDVSHLSALTQLRIADNSFTTLDVSNNPALVRLECENNNLTYLNVKNGNNTNMSNGNFVATGNPSLICITVDDATWSTNNWTNIDNTASFNDLGCRYTTIPDANFEAELEALGYDDVNGDGQVPTRNIETVTDLDLRSKTISDLTGIEDFIALKSLNLKNNSLTSINLTNNTDLETLGISENDLTSIDLSKNLKLTTLDIGANPLTSLDVSNNTSLTRLECPVTDITSIDVSNLTQLTFLELFQTDIATLDVSNNLVLGKLILYRTKLTSLDISLNTELTQLRIDYTDISTIDLTTNTKLTEVRVNGSDITTIDLTNQVALTDFYGQTGVLENINIKNGNNTNIINFDVRNNDNLTCIKVDNPTWSTTNWTNIDNTANFSLYCDYTAIPDAKFEAELAALGYDDISGDGQVPTDLIKVVDVLSIGNKGISDLTGIEDFSALTRLTCNDNTIQNLDLRNNTLLEYIKCDDNNMDVLHLENLQYFEELVGFGNDFTDFDFTNNPKLKKISIFNNEITSLDLSKNPELIFIRLDQNNLNYLDVRNGTNTNITLFNAEGNSNLSCIFVDNVAYSTTNWTDIYPTTNFRENYCNYTTIPDANFEAALEALGYDDISGDGQVPTALIEVVEDLTIVAKSITDITGIEDFTALKTLNCASNSFTSLDLSNNTNLTSVITKFTPIASLNVSDSPNLDILVCSFNDLSTLDVSKNTALTYLECNNNNLTNLDVSLNTALLDLRCGDNSLNTLDVSTNTLLTSIWCQNNSITELDFSNQTALVSITVNDNNLISLNVKNGNNTNVTNFVAQNNSDLYCISVDDSAYSTTNWLGIDDTAYFNNTGCRYTQIPDANFEAELEALGYDDISGDGQVPTYLIEGVTSLALPNKGISDLTGIEDFVALTSLNCRVNNLTSLNVTQNTLLKTLTSDGNSLTSIDLSNNTDLEILNLAGSNLTSLDLTNNTSLRKLLVNGNGGLTSLDISNNTKLVEFKAYATNIAALDFSVHPDLETLECYGTQISTVDFSNNPELRVLRVDNTNITELNLSNNPNIETLHVNDTGITSLDLSKQIVLKNLYAHETNLSYLNVKNGNNTNVTTFRAENNPNLTCIVVDNATYSTTNWTDIDGTASFTDTYCRYTAIPDANFEAALENLGYDDISGDGQVPTILIEGITTLDVKNLSITDFTGIEDFVGLTSLDVGNNNAGSIDITNLVLLEFVRLDAMSLTSIDLSKNTALVDLRCSFNSGITSIDVSNNTLLETAHVGNNSLTNIDLSNNTLLHELRMSNNNLTSVDLSKNTALTELILSNNELSYLNLKNANNTNMLIFYSTGNPLLSCVLVDDANYSTTNWTNIDDTTNFRDTNYCNYTAIPDAKFEARLEALGYDDISGDGQVPTELIEGITSLTVNKQSITDFTGIQDFTSLTSLDVGNNSAGSIDISNLVLLEFVRLDAMSLSSIDVSKNTALTDLRCSYNSGMTNIDISKNTLLETIHISNNSLTSVDVSNNPLLYELRASSNDLTTIDVSKNTKLLGLNLSNNPNLTSLDLANNTILQELSATNCGLNSVTSINTTDLKEVRLSNNNLTSLDLSNSIASIFELYVGENNLTSLDVTGAVRLFTLSAYSNSITNLDLSTATSIEIINVSYNSLSYLNLKNGKNNLVLSFNAENNAALECILVDDADYSTTRWSDIDNTASFSDTNCGYIQLAINAYLQGAYINPNSGEESLMRDDLRIAGGTYGSTSPYSDAATISDAIKLDDAGVNSMVDWVWVELRDSTNPDTVIAGKSGILQRDGDIVETTDDRSTPLLFDATPGDYFVVIKHRNHLSIKTSSVVSFSTTAVTAVDLTSSSNIISGGTNAVIDMGNGIFAMISGDFDENGQIQNIDTNAVIQLLGVSGYNKADLDMNGQVQNVDINNLLNPNIGKGEQF